MEYQIYTKKEITEEIYYPKKLEDSNAFSAYDCTSLKHGKLNLNDLKAFKWNEVLSDIPESKMAELNETGNTVFTVVTTQTVVLKKP
ncbi:hypothetical protein [uncultured Chryseobacterium sp.]|uniref:hypothetical protein n=1 Tax=uncultured Chryseobacterium sp. TaxID=259322 RepID=UPI0025DA896C|nr:hypothetical protein [uncultured Chryseobacterium sp.]